MKKIKRILALVLVLCMVFGMLPAMSAFADDEAPAANFMEIATNGNNKYLSTVGSNAFNVFMYDNTFSGTFGDQHMGGIELSLNGIRIATNGDTHMLPTPEQWDATPAPSRGTKVYDAATNTRSASTTARRMTTSQTATCPTILFSPRASGGSFYAKIVR